MYLPQRHTALLWGIVNPNLTALIYYMVLIEIRLFLELPLIGLSHATCVIDML